MFRWLAGLFAIILGLMLSLGLTLPARARVTAPPTHHKLPLRHITPHQSSPISCSYNAQEARILGTALCGVGPEMVADTLPGSPGSPSPQVITVQGCTGCISTGSGGGGGGGGSSYTGVNANVYGQTGTAASFGGIAGTDQLNGNIDAITVAPFGGNGSGTGYPASYGQPGVLVVQGGLQGGAIGISGNLGGPYNGTQSGQTATTQSFFGMGGIYNSSAPTLTNTQYSPVQLDASANLKINCVTGCTGGSSVTIAGGTAGATPVPVSGTVTASFPYSIPTTTPTAQPALASSGALQMGADYSGNVNAQKVDASGNQYVVLSQVGGTGTMGALNASVIIPVVGTSVTFTVTGTWTGTVTMKGSSDYAELGAASATFPFTQNCTYQTTFGAVESTFTNNNSLICNTNGVTAIRLQMTSYTSGTATINYGTSSTGYGTNILGTSGALIPSIQVNGDNASVNAQALNVEANSFAYDSVDNEWARIYKGPFPRAPLYVTDAGNTNTIIAAAAAGPTVVSSTPAIIVRFLVTTTGTSTAVQFYDSSSSCSSGSPTEIGYVPGTATAGTVYTFNLRAGAGITACGGTGSPGGTLSFSN